MNKGVGIFLLILVLGGLFAYQTAKAFWLKNELAEKIVTLLPQMSKTNQTEIRDQVIAEAKTRSIELSPDDVLVSYEPTEDQKYAQKFVSKLATFENYKATIVVKTATRVWGIALSSEPIERWQITQEKAISRRQPELDEAMKMADDAQSGAHPAAAPAPPPAPQPAAPTSTRQQILKQLPTQRREVDESQ